MIRFEGCVFNQLLAWFVQSCKENIVSESYEAIVPLYSLLLSFFLCLHSVWISTDQLCMKSGAYHHRLLVRILRQISTELVFISELFVRHYLLVKWICDLTEYLLFQFDWVLKLYLLFTWKPWKLIRTSERLLSGVSATCTALFFGNSRSKPPIIFIFFR